MSLRVYDMEQRSPEWFDVRRGIVTASTVGQLITPSTVKVAANAGSRSLVHMLVAERITGWTEDGYVSHDMLVGQTVEPVARQIYSEHFAPVTECGFMTEDRWGVTIGYSPDGLVGDAGLIEVKSRLPKEQVATVLSGTVPAENMAQIQCGLLVTGREWLDYVSYSGGMALWVTRVLPDPQWQDAITEAVDRFEKTAAQMVADYRAAVVGLPLTERTSYDMDMVI